jgi:tRNA-2-methylthio-N6-dimethylallyladenosine synthase
VEVLVEDRNPKNGEEVMGRTRQGRQVFFPGNVDKLKGELVMVEILEARTWSLIGKISVNVPTKSTDNTDVKRNNILS